MPHTHIFSIIFLRRKYITCQCPVHSLIGTITQTKYQAKSYYQWKGREKNKNDWYDGLQRARNIDHKFATESIRENPGRQRTDDGTHKQACKKEGCCGFGILRNHPAK